MKQFFNYEIVHKHFIFKTFCIQRKKNQYISETEKKLRSIPNTKILQYTV